MVTNFTANLLIAKLCFASGSPGLYGYYAITTAISFFLPVMDLGIGQSIYNDFTKSGEADFSIGTLKIYMTYLLKTSIFWMTVLIVTATAILAFNRQSQEGLATNQQFFAFLVSIIIYIISIPMSSGFKVLHSLSKIDKALLIQSTVSPLTLIAIYITSVLNLNITPVAIVAPSIAFLISNVLALKVAKLFLKDSLSNASKNLISWATLLNTGFWVVLLNLLNILSTFLPRLILQNRGLSDDLDRYAFLFTIVTPFLSLTTLFAMQKSPNYRRLPKKAQRQWLIENLKISIGMAIGITFMFVVLIYLLPIINLPTLNRFETKIAIAYILIHASFFLLLSSQTEKMDLKVFGFIYLFSIAVQTLININFSTMDFQSFLLLNVLLITTIQGLGVGIYSFFRHSWHLGSR
jgi:hypothetical protein